MTVLYIAPVSAGSGDGSSAQNAGSLANLPEFISAAGAGGAVLMIADQGTYQAPTSPIQVFGGGAEGQPVTIRGVDSLGNAMNAVISGTRSDPYDVNGVVGEEIFRLLDGADNLSFSNMTFNNIGYGAFRVGADIENLTIENIKAENVQRFFEDYASGTNKTATISGLTIRAVEVDGFSKGVIRLAYDTHDVLIEDVRGDSQRQDGDNFAIGVHIDGTAHDIVLRRVSMSNAQDTLHSNFYNGDGFATEGGAYQIRFEDTVSSGNADAGYDIKSKATVLVRAVSDDNARNFRIWNKDTTLEDIVSLDPHLRGGNSSQNHVWFAIRASAALDNPLFSDITSTTAFGTTEGYAVINIANLTMMIGASAKLAVLGKTSVLNAQGTTYGVSVASYTDQSTATQGLNLIGGAGNDVILTGAGDDDLKGGGGGDLLSGGLGNDRLLGGDGDDILMGGGGRDTLIGGQGFDFASYADSITGVEVNLRAGAPGGGALGDMLTGIEGLIGSAHDDTLTGDSSDNVIIGGAGADVIDGGDGVDVVDYSASSGGVFVDLGGGPGSGGDAEGDTLSHVEVVIGSAFDDVLLGGDNADRFIGGAGGDLIIGGGGVDIADYSNSAVGVAIDLATGVSTGGDAAGDLLVGIEIIVGTNFADNIQGDETANVLRGGGGGDRLGGGGGDDRLFGGAGADVLIGDGGFDVVDYSENAAAVKVDLLAGVAQGGDAEGDLILDVEAVVGSQFNDWLIGNAGDNRLDGGLGDDRLAGGAGADELIGGEGFDAADYSDSSQGVYVDFSSGAGGGDAQGDTFSSIESVVGSSHNDSLVAGGSTHRLVGGAGDDILKGFSSADILVGGVGADLLIGAGEGVIADYSASASGVAVDLGLGLGLAGDAAGDRYLGIGTVVGSAFADVLLGDGNDNRLVGGAGADTLAGGGGFDTADYSISIAAVAIDLGSGVSTGGDAEGDMLSGIERIVGSNLDDHLTGDAGSNIFVGGLGADILVGGEGVDVADYSGSASGVTINLVTNINTGGEAAGDLLSGVETIIGTAFVDTLTGDGAVNVLLGGDGGDLLDGGLGADTLIGGAGNDQYWVDSVDDVVVEDLDGGADRVWTSLGVYSLGANLESLSYTDVGDFTGYGNDLDNGFSGGVGNETFFGGQGDDKFQGSLGADTFYGGDGRNSVDYSKSKLANIINLVTNINNGGDAEGDVLFDVYQISASNYDDVVTGDDKDNVVYGRGGIDIIHGGGGNDKLDGGAGADILYGGAGDDTYTIDEAADQTIEAANEGVDTVVTKLATWTLAAHVENLTAKTSQIFNGFGNESNNVLIGGTNNDVLYGLDGDDVLDGGGGADQLFGGAGFDTASYLQSLVGVVIDVSAGSALGGDAEGDQFESIERLVGSRWNDHLTGGAAADVFDGAAGDDMLDGGAGDDILVGGVGADLLIGGAGTDVASYALSAEGVSVSLMTGLGSGGDALGDTLSGIERLVGSAFADLLAGDAGANVIDGGLGDDILQGWGGDDTLLGSQGADSISGGDGVDTLTYASSKAGVTINLLTGLASGGDAESDVFTGIENLTGSIWDDILTGNGESNFIHAGAGNDFIAAGGGADFVSGGAGNDVIDGGEGIDTVLLTGSRSSYSFSLASGVLSIRDLRGEGGDGLDRVSNAEALEFLGGDVAPLNAVRSSWGSEKFVGTGGHDIFLFATDLGLALGSDSITNFGAGDVIVLTSAIYDSNNDGVIGFASNQRVNLPGTIGSGNTQSTGTLKISSTTGAVVTSLDLIGSQVENGVKFYVYAAHGDKVASATLDF